MHSAPHTIDATQPARPRVLVIDDDPLFRALLSAMLKRDYIVSTAADGSEGFYKALESPPDLAIVDIQMPVWDGMRTLRAFRDNSTLKSVRLIVLTSDASQETLLAALAAGANDYVIKTGFTREEFLEKLRRVGQPTVPPLSLVTGPDAVPAPRSRERVTAATAPRGESPLQEVLDAWE